MDIERLSTDLSVDKVREQAAAQVQNMALRQAEEENAALVKLIDSAAADPGLGNRINILA
jgi:hypothetical protein